MPTYQTLVARGLARALLAGKRDHGGLRARALHALGSAEPAWLAPVLAELAPLSQPTWERLTLDALAARIRSHAAFHSAFTAGEPPRIRASILRPSRMRPAPLGLDHLVLPEWPDAQSLSRWLGIAPDDLDWFSADPQRRRNAPLASQHYGFSMRPKRRGGGRLIEAPRQRLKALQARLHDGLLAQLPVHERCHGFVRGRSVASHVQAHAGQAVVLRFDLMNFFASVGAGQVRALFETLGYPGGVARDLTALCTVRTPDAVIDRMRDARWLDWHQARCLRSAHLPQGAPSSPMLANLCAFRLDLRLDGLAHAIGARYSRYADDLVLSGPTALAAAFPRVQAWVGRVALEEGYALNHRKTTLMTQATAQRVCGVVVNAHPNLPRGEFDRLRATLHRCVLHGPVAPAPLTLDGWRQHLNGRIAWAEQLNPAKAQRLRALWARIPWPEAG